MLRFIPDEPVILIKTHAERIMVIADLHIGFEKSISSQGIRIPSQTGKMLERIISLLEKHNPDRLILLGDVKHEVAGVSSQEYREIPVFLKRLQSYADVEIIPGNHDGDIKSLAPSGIDIHSPRGILIDDIALIHGHAWHSPDLFSSGIFVMAHNHLTVEFRYYGYRMVKPVWVETKWNKDRLRSAYQKFSKVSVPIGDPRIILMPAFNQLLGGMAVNARIKDLSLLGPLFPSIELENSDIYLLDGTYLGRLSQVRGIGL